MLDPQRPSLALVQRDRLKNQIAVRDPATRSNLFFAPPVEKIAGPRCPPEARLDLRGFPLDEELGLLVTCVVDNREVEMQSSTFAPSAKRKSLIAVSSWSLRSLLANGILILMANSRNSAAYQYPLSNPPKVILSDNLRFLAGPFGLGTPAIVNHIRSVRVRTTGHPQVKPFRGHVAGKRACRGLGCPTSVKSSGFGKISLARNTAHIGIESWAQPVVLSEQH